MRRIRYSLIIGLAGLFFMRPSLAQAYYPYYQAPAYASPNAAALGPWPWSFDIGGGPTTVAGSSHNQLTGGSNFLIGAGYNFTPRAGLMLEFMDSGLGVTNSTLQQNGAYDGSAWVHSITLNPIWRFRISGPLGGYIIGGGGYYEREIAVDQTFTFPVQTFRGTFDATGVQTTRQYDDTGGLDIGAGLTCNIAWGTKFFVEARYHYIFTSGTATQIIPVTLGLRW